jgi:hypothetical protein
VDLNQASKILRRMFIKTVLLTIILLLCHSVSFQAQILNVDRENGTDTIFKKIKASVISSFASDKQKNNFLEFSNTTELDYFLKNNYFFILLNQTDLAFNGKKAIENNGFIQIRFRDKDTRVVALDAFTQFQWNGILGMESRSLLGANCRINCLEKKKSDLYLCIGAFYELENWNTNLSTYAYSNDLPLTIKRELIRLNTSAKFAFKLGDKVDFAGVNFIQFPLNGQFLKPRWAFDSNLYFEMSKKLNFIFHYDHNYDVYRVLPIDNYYYNVSLGIQLKL